MGDVGESSDEPIEDPAVVFLDALAECDATSEDFTELAKCLTTFLKGKDVSKATMDCMVLFHQIFRRYMALEADEEDEHTSAIYRVQWRRTIAVQLLLESLDELKVEAGDMELFSEFLQLEQAPITVVLLSQNQTRTMRFEWPGTYKYPT